MGISYFIWDQFYTDVSDLLSTQPWSLISFLLIPTFQGHGNGKESCHLSSWEMGPWMWNRTRSSGDAWPSSERRHSVFERLPVHIKILWHLLCHLLLAIHTIVDVCVKKLPHGLGCLVMTSFGNPWGYSEQN